MSKEVICIVCPKGCHIQVYEEGHNPPCEGNACHRGEVYALQEVRQPTRVLTGTVAIRHAVHARCPVMSSRPVPKEHLMAVMLALKDVELIAPMHMGDVVLSNVLGLGIDIVATRNLDRIK